MKSTKKKIMSLTAFAVALFVTFTAIPYVQFKVNAIDTSVEAEEALRDEIASLQSEQDEIKAKLEKAKENEAAQEQQKEYLDSLIFSTLNEIDAAEELIAEYGTQIEQKTKQIEDLETEMEEKMEALKNRLHYSYVEGNASYLEMLLNSDSFVNFLITAERVGYLLNYDRSLMEDIKAGLNQLEEDKVYLENALVSQEELKVSLEESEAELEVRLKETETYIAQLQEDQAVLEEDYQRVKKLEQEANAKVEQILKERIPKNPTNYGASGPEFGGTFIFPVDRAGYKYASSEYGWRTLWGYQDFHLGIDLAANYGTPVYASAAGTVVVSEWHYSYGYYVVVDHGNGFATLYAHNSQLLVSVGQSVAQGDIIARVGSTGSSSGNHLHFEVRINGETTNPRNYVTIY